MKRIFQRFRDDRFALTTLQNPNIEVRTYAELVQAAQQEREWQPGAAQIAATQPLAAPAAPDSIPTMEFPENDAAVPPEPEPAALAPLDSATLDAGNPDSANPNPTNDAADPDPTNPFSTNNGAQQILDSLVADVLAAGTSLPSPSSDDHEITTPPTPKPRRKAKTKSHRKSESRHSAIHPEIPPREIEGPEPTPLERHTRKCSICKHPHRQYIEEAFLQWRSPDTIKRCWDLQSRTTIYHHAHAFNLFTLRSRNLQLALGNMIEDADNQGFTASHILHAIRFLAHISEDGRWTHATHKSEVTYSMQRLPAMPGLPAGKGQPAHLNAEPTLIATQILNTDATH
jgi:hypothetical protein